MAFSDFIEQLPEVTDFIRSPVYDKDLTDVTALALRGNAIRNPLRGGLSNAIGNLQKSISAVSALEKKIAASKNTLLSTSTGVDRFSGVLGPAGLGSTVIGRAESVSTASTNPQLKSAISALKTGKGNMISALGQANRLLEHSNLMTGNVPQVGGIINDAIATPSKFTSDEPGALPSSFPSLIPSYNVPGGFPNFSGINLPSLPNLELESVDLPAMPNVGSLTGVSIPGTPVPDDVLNGFAGSLAGVGPDLASSLSNYAEKLPDLTSDVSNIVGELNTTPVDTVTGVATNLSPSVSSPTNLAALNDFSDLTDGLGEMAGGMSDLVGGETGGIAAASCSTLSLGAGCGSISQASGLASSLVSLASTSTTAKLVDSVATGPLRSKLVDIASGSLVSGALTLATGGTGALVAGALSSAVSSAVTGVISETVAEAGGGIIGGAISNDQDLLDAARTAAGQGSNVVGGISSKGKDAITQAQNLAASSISEAQVVAKAIVNDSVDTITDRIRDNS